MEADKYGQPHPEECPTSGVMSVVFVPVKSPPTKVGTFATSMNKALPNRPQPVRKSECLTLDFLSYLGILLSVSVS